MSKKEYYNLCLLDFSTYYKPSDIRKLIKKGAVVDTTDSNGTTRLMSLCLLGRGANTNKKHLECIRILLENNANVNLKSTSKGSALIFAVINNKEDVVCELLWYAADPNITDAFLNTPLHFAAEGNVNILEILLKFGANPNVRNKLGYTPLHISYIFKKPQITSILLNYGADPNFT